MANCSPSVLRRVPCSSLHKLQLLFSMPWMHFGSCLSAAGVPQLLWQGRIALWWTRCSDSSESATRFKENLCEPNKSQIQTNDTWKGSLLRLFLTFMHDKNDTFLVSDEGLGHQLVLSATKYIYWLATNEHWNTGFHFPPYNCALYWTG